MEEVIDWMGQIMMICFLAIGIIIAIVAFVAIVCSTISEIKEDNKMEKKLKEYSKSHSIFWILKQNGETYLLSEEPTETYHDGEYVIYYSEYVILKNSWFKEITEKMGPVKVTIKIEE
jgi:hypothetical protein